MTVGRHALHGPAVPVFSPVRSLSPPVALNGTEWHGRHRRLQGSSGLARVRGEGGRALRLWLQTAPRCSGPVVRSTTHPLSSMWAVSSSGLRSEHRDTNTRVFNPVSGISAAGACGSHGLTFISSGPLPPAVSRELAPRTLVGTWWCRCLCLSHPHGRTVAYLIFTSPQRR